MQQRTLLWTKLISWRWNYRFEWRSEHLIYLLNASDFHRPNWRIWLSDRPCVAVVVAAPILKLWLWKHFGSNLQNCRASFNCALKSALVIGVFERYINTGPGPVPRIWMYHWRFERGQMATLLFLLIFKVNFWPWLCLKELNVRVIEWWSRTNWSMCNRLGLWRLSDCTVISPILRKAWNAKENIARKRSCLYQEFIVHVVARISFSKIHLSIGNLTSQETLFLWHACSSFCIRKEFVGSA